MKQARQYKFFFSTKAYQAYIFPQIEKPLVSMGKFCDDGKIALLTQNKCIILNNITKLNRIKNLININTLLEGDRDNETKLWKIDLTHTETANSETASSVYHYTKIADTIDYHHCTLLSPVTSTWIKAIQNGNLSTWPNLTAEHVKNIYARP